MGIEIPGLITSNTHFEHHTVETSAQALSPHTTEKQAQPEKKEAHAPEDIEKVVDMLEKTATIFNKRLRIHINKEINRVVVKIVDIDTDKVIKEIPPHELQELIARIKKAIGVLVDEQI